MPPIGPRAPTPQEKNMAGPGSALTNTDKNLWSAILAEAVANLKYTAYANQALHEGHPEVIGTMATRARASAISFIAAGLPLLLASAV